MSGTGTTPGFTEPAAGADEAREAARDVAALWWGWLVVGIAWIVAALVILQFDSASVTTVGIIIGIMFALAGVQQMVLAMLAPRLRWLFALFGGFFLAASVVCFFNPAETFAGLADILGFLFLTVGVWWTIRPLFVEDASGPFLWLGVLSGMLMIVLAFWTSGQFFLEKAYTLLVFAGIWALLHGVGDIVRAFQVRSVRDAL